MNNIIPALLETKFEKLQSRLVAVYNHAPLIQIDLCDGKFVDSASWPYSDEMELTALHSLRKYFDKVELDLMIQDPDPAVFAPLYPARIILHWNSFAVDTPDNYFYKFQSSCQALGLAIPATASEFQLVRIAEFVMAHPQFTYLQVMGIKVRGRQGQQFYEPVVDTIAHIQKLLPDYPLQIDGGMNARSVAIVRQLGISTMVAGSSVWDSENALAAIEKMQSVIE